MYIYIYIFPRVAGGGYIVYRDLAGREKLRIEKLIRRAWRESPHVWVCVCVYKAWATSWLPREEEEVREEEEGRNDNQDEEEVDEKKEETERRNITALCLEEKSH